MAAVQPRGDRPGRSGIEHPRASSRQHGDEPPERPATAVGFTVAAAARHAAGSRARSGARRMSAELAARSLDPQTFTRYGIVLEQPTRPHDAEGPGWRWWAETASLAATGKAYGIGFLDLRPAP